MYSILSTVASLQATPRKKLAKAIHNKSLQTVLSAVLLGGVCSVSADASEINEFSISSQSLNSALAQFSSQSGLQLVVNDAAVRQLSAPELTGKLSNDEALSKLLSGTGLSYEFRNGDTVLIKVVEDSEDGSSGEDDVDEEVLVTGSRLATDRSKVAGQLISFDEEYIKSSGETTLERFLRRLPQNFGGTTEFAGSNLNGANNNTGASTVNLRGLGDRGTLILVNGHRRNFNGTIGGVTDISGIPLPQVERIEVLLDGASAVYGADAVGGVINIITKKDYRGTSLGVELLEPSAGEFNEYKVTLNGGTSWEDGDFRASYEYYKHTGLAADDSILGLTLPENNALSLFTPPTPGLLGQIVTSSVDSLALFYNGPGGNITFDEFNALDSADQTMFSPVFAATLPAGFDENSSIDDITILTATDNSVTGTGETDFGRLLLPERESHTLSFDLTQELGNSITLHTSLVYANRDVATGGGVPRISTRVDSGNPLGPLSLDGREYTYTILLPELGGSGDFDTSDSDQWDLSMDLDGEFSENWNWSVNGTYSRSTTDGVRGPRLDAGAIADGTNNNGTQSVSVLQGTPPPSPDCVFTSSGFGFDRYTCPADVEQINAFGDLSAFLLPEEFLENKNTLKVLSANVRGTLFDLPAGPVRVAAGVEWQDRGIDSRSEFAIGTQLSTVVDDEPFAADVSRSSQAVFVEGIAPLVSEDNNLPLVQALDLTFSGRYDSYSTANADISVNPSNLDLDDPDEVADFAPFNQSSDVGGDSTWGAGLIWTLNDQVRFRTNWQTAFVAPQLNQLFSLAGPLNNFAFLFVQNEEGNLAFVSFDLAIAGGNPGLRPETSRSRNLSIEFTPDFLTGLVASITHSETDYIDRITSLNSNGAIVTLDNLPSDVIVFNDDPLSLGLDTRPTNAERLERSGLDYNINYNLDTEIGLFNADLVISKLIKHNFRPDAADDPVSVVGSTSDPRFFPIPKYSSNLQVSWTHRGFTTALSAAKRRDTNRLTLNSDDEVTAITTSSSPESVNLTLSYDFGSGDFIDSPQWLDGVVTTVGVENLTNDFSERIVNNLITGEVEISTANSITALGRGRVFRLSLQKEF